MGVRYTYYEISYFQNYLIDIALIGKVILSGIFFGLIAYLIVYMLKKIEHAVERVPLHPYKKAFLAGVLLIVLSFFVGDRYFGLGLDSISNALQFQSVEGASMPWYAFILKIFYTAVTLGSGGSGGIVTPIFYIGATSGHFFGSVFANSDQVALFAALGFVSVLAGATNAPIAAIIMAMELFGMDVAHYAVISIAISFLVLGHRSVFPSQKLSMSKSDMLKIDYGEDIAHSSVSLDLEQTEQLKRLKRRIKIERVRNKKLLQSLRRKKNSRVPNKNNPPR